MVTTLYTCVRAQAATDEVNEIMTTWTFIEHKRRPGRSMRGAVGGFGLSQSPANYLDGLLGLKASIVDSRNIRQ